MIGTGYLSGNDDNDKGWFNNFWGKNNDWFKKSWDDFSFDKFMGFMSSDDSDDDKCDCEKRKKDHKEHYDGYKKYYDENKKHFKNNDYKKHLDDFKKYFDNNKHSFDKDDFKKYMDYYGKYLDDNKKHFSSKDYKKYHDEYKKYSDEYPSHGDHCTCMDDNDDKSMVEHALISFNIAQRELKEGDQIYFQNIVDECIFETEDSFAPLCVKCKFLDWDNNLVAKGEVVKLDESYTAHTELIIPMASVPFAAPYTPVANDVQSVDKVEVSICGKKHCECEKPDRFVVKYFGPTIDKVEISKNGKDTVTINGPFYYGDDIVVDAIALGFKNGKVYSETTYNFIKDGKSVGTISIHTSCSQTLFVGQMFFYHEGKSDQIKLTVESGTLKGKPSIPDASCDIPEPDPDPKCDECEKPDVFTVKYNGPNNAQVIVSKNGKDPVSLGTYDDGDLIILDAINDLGQTRVNSETTYTIITGYGKSTVSIHTSCSQPLYVGQMFFDDKITNPEIKLTVESGTLKGKPSIPDESCPVPHDDKKKYDDDD